MTFDFEQSFMNCSIELECLYYPYSNTLPLLPSLNYNGFELYWLCFLPLIMLGIPLCLTFVPIQNVVTSIKITNTPLIADQMNGLDPKWVIPRHIAVILDGNRRYGRSKYGIPVKGHQAGSEKLVDFIQWCLQTGVQILTVYAFSTENWNRDQHEVDALMNIFTKFMHEIVPRALEKNVKVCVLVSDNRRLPASILQSIQDIEAATSHCTKLHLNICVSYGARDEIVQACKSIATNVVNGFVRIEDINEETLGKHLLTKNVCDPDILVRTSGELRISNFLLYQIAYTELIFLEKMWPALTFHDFVGIVDEYNRRKRRFGK